MNSFFVEPKRGGRTPAKEKIKNNQEPVGGKEKGIIKQKEKNSIPGKRSLQKIKGKRGTRKENILLK